MKSPSGSSPIPHASSHSKPRTRSSRHSSLPPTTSTDTVKLIQKLSAKPPSQRGGPPSPIRLQDLERIPQSHCQPARLTAANLKHHTRLVNGVDMPTDEPPTVKSTSDGGTSNTTTTDPLFGVHLLAHHVIQGDNPNVLGPVDLKTMIERLDRERTSPTPDLGTFELYKERMAACRTEDNIREQAWRFFGKGETVDYWNDMNAAWNNVKSELTQGLSVPKPDRAMSYKLSKYPAETIEALGGALRPCVNGSTSMPHLCVEYKSRTGDFENAIEQSAYNGAVMVRSARKVHEYLGLADADFLGKTQAVTIAFNGRQVWTFANHAVVDSNVTYYHQATLFSDIAHSTFEHFQTAYKHVRNAQDWAQEFEKQKLDALIAHEKVQKDARTQMLVEEQMRVKEAMLRLVQDVQNQPMSPPSSVPEGSKSFQHGSNDQDLIGGDSSEPQPKKRRTGRGTARTATKSAASNVLA